MQIRLIEPTFPKFQLWIKIVSLPKTSICSLLGDGEFSLALNICVNFNKSLFFFISIAFSYESMKDKLEHEFIKFFSAFSLSTGQFQGRKVLTMKMFPTQKKLNGVLFLKVIIDFRLLVKNFMALLQTIF